jgi:hypothetical protein
MLRPIVLCVLLSACGGVIAPNGSDDETSTKTESLTIDSALRVGTPSTTRGWTLRVHVTNGTSAPVYVFEQLYGEHLDDETHLLSVMLNPEPTLPPPNLKLLDCHLMIPTYTKIAAGKSVDIDVQLPLEQIEALPVASPEDPAHFVTQLLTSATSVDVSLGWSDRPLTYGKAEEQLCEYDGEVFLEGLERGIVKGSFSL